MERLRPYAREFVCGLALWRLLGFKSARSYQLALQRGARMPVRLFPVPGRKGRRARTLELARWLVSMPDWEQRIEDLAALIRATRRRSTG